MPRRPTPPQRDRDRGGLTDSPEEHQFQDCVEEQLDMPIATYDPTTGPDDPPYNQTGNTADINLDEKEQERSNDRRPYRRNHIAFAADLPEHRRGRARQSADESNKVYLETRRNNRQRKHNRTTKEVADRWVDSEYELKNWDSKDSLEGEEHENNQQHVSSVLRYQRAPDRSYVYPSYSTQTNQTNPNGWQERPLKKPKFSEERLEMLETMLSDGSFGVWLENALGGLEDRGDRSPVSSGKRRSDSFIEAHATRGRARLHRAYAPPAAYAEDSSDSLPTRRDRPTISNFERRPDSSIEAHASRGSARLHRAYAPPAAYAEDSPDLSSASHHAQQGYKPARARVDSDPERQSLPGGTAYSIHRNHQPRPPQPPVVPGRSLGARAAETMARQALNMASYVPSPASQMRDDRRTTPPPMPPSRSYAVQWDNRRVTDPINPPSQAYAVQQDNGRATPPPMPGSPPIPVSASFHLDGSRARWVDQVFKAGKEALFFATTRRNDKGQPKTAVLNIATLQVMTMHALQYEIAWHVGSSFNESTFMTYKVKHLIDGSEQTEVQLYDLLSKYCEAVHNLEYMKDIIERRIMEEVGLIPNHVNPPGDLPQPYDYSKAQLRHSGRHAANKAVANEQRLLRLTMASAGGLLLIVPMLIMANLEGKVATLVTTCVSMSIFAILVTWATNLGPNEVLGTTAAYAAVLVVFVGTSLAS